MNKRISMLLLCLLPLMGTVAQTFIHPWQKKRVAYFGDSITDPDVKCGTEKWWTYLDRMLQLTSYCYGTNGRQWDDIPRQARLLEKEHGQDVDAILVLMGTNDYNAGVPIGDWYEYRDTLIHEARGRVGDFVRRMRVPSMNPGTFRGRINRALSLMKHLFPTKQIVLLTPLHRSYAKFSEDNIQPDERFCNAAGEFVDAYRQSIVEAGRIWAMPVIDLANDSGLYPLEQGQKQYFSRPGADELHPNDAGYKRMAETLYYRLAALPCTF